MSYLTESLVELGYDVTLFAAGDSKTRARLVSTITRAARSATRPATCPLAARASEPPDDRGEAPWQSEGAAATG